MAEHPSRNVAEWVEEQRRAGNADALRWLIGRAGFALLGLYPPDRGPDILWGIFRGLVPEPERCGVEFRRELEACADLVEGLLPFYEEGSHEHAVLVDRLHASRAALARAEGG